jgi:aspartate racemase
MIQAGNLSIHKLESKQLSQDSIRQLSETSIVINRANSEHKSSHFQAIHQWFEAQAETTPNAIALCFKDQFLTYAALNQRANQVAHFLRQQGLEPQEFVVISTHRSLEMVIGFLGVLKAGGAYVPIDPTYPIERRAYQLEDVKARFILTQQNLVEFLPHHTAKTICLDSGWHSISHYSDSNPDLTVTSEQLAYIIYTSGSTGTPKGVMVRHRGVVNHSQAIIKEFEFTDRDRVLQFSSISFDVTVEQLFPALVSGATVVLRTDNALSSTERFLQFIEQQQITILLLPVAFWHEWVNGMALLQVSVPPCVRLVAVGGEKPSPTVYAQWRTLVGAYPRWLNGYGPTETTITCTLYDPIAANYDPNQGEIPIGTAIANTEVYILDTELQPVPFGEVGELYVGGPGVAQGYLNLPEQTTTRFIPNPFSPDPNSRLYKTGDRVRYQPDGHLLFLGRFDFQVKIRGFRVELEEIEHQIEQHDTIQQAIVLAHPHLSGQKQLIAYLKSASHQSINHQELRQFLQSRLPDYMIPTVFITVEAFPLSPNGKVDRERLLLLLTDENLIDSDIQAPTNAIETQLTQIWQDILGISPISITDNFFDVGGHSLQVVRLTNQILHTFNVHLPLSTLLQAPTIAQLAAIITQRTQLNSLVELRAGGDLPPIFLIHDGDGETLLYRNLANLLASDHPVYGIQPQVGGKFPILQTRITDMVTTYLQQIQAVQPTGPYYLGGLCAGGVLAYEIACQLQQQGHSVAMVALFDAVHPSLDRSQWIQTQRRDRIAQIIYQKQSASLWNLLQRGAIVLKKALNLIRYETISRLESALNLITFDILRFCSDRQQTPPAWLKPLAVRKVYLLAEAEYVPSQQFVGSLLLFRATQGQEDDQPYQEIYNQPDLGWGPCSTQAVSIYDVPGGHSSLLRLPHVQAIADRLNTHLTNQVSLGHVHLTVSKR